MQKKVSVVRMPPAKPCPLLPSSYTPFLHFGKSLLALWATRTNSHHIPQNSFHVKVAFAYSSNVEYAQYFKINSITQEIAQYEVL
jgi:hypothetical protein